MGDLKPHSIQCPTDINRMFVVGMCDFNEKIWIAYESGHFFALSYNPDSTGAPYTLTSDTPITKLFDDCKISNMASILKPHLMLINYYKAGKIQEPDALVVFDTKMNIEELDILVPKCSMFALSYEDKYPNLVVALNKKFSIYTMDKENQHEKGSEYFNLVATKEAGSMIQAIGINEHAVAFYANSKYRTYWIETGTFVEVSSSFVERPFVLPITENNFLIGNQEYMIVTGKIGEKPSSSIPYNKGYTKLIPPGRPRSLFFYKDNVFQFHEKTTLVGHLSHDTRNPVFKNIQVPAVRNACKRFHNNLDDLLLMTDEDMYTVGGVSLGSRLADRALRGGILEPSFDIQKIKNVQDQNDVIVDMFNDLWVRETKSKNGDVETAKILAIQLLSNVVWRMDIREVLSLFPFIMLANPLEKRVILVSTQPVENPSKQLLQELGKFLIFTSEQYKLSDDNSLLSQLSIVDTSIFQFYAAFHQTRELDAFMKDQNSIDIQLVSQYFAQNLKPLKLYPALAIYYTRTEKQVKALEYWKVLNNQDPKTSRWALEASYTLQEISQKNILDEHLAWIKRRNVSHAVNALLHPNVDTAYAQEWIKANCPNYMIKFFDFIVQQTNPAPKIPLVEEALYAFCELLKNLEDPEFEVRKVTYNHKAATASKGPHPEMLEELGNECAEKISNIIHTYGAKKGVDLAPYVEIIKETKHRSLLFEFYQISEMYSEAMELIFSGNSPNYKELEDFCRNSPNCEAAFSHAFKTMIQKNKDFISVGIDFLIKNMEWVNYEEMLDWIPDDTPLEAVEKLLKIADNYLIQKERVMKTKLNIAKSMKKDVDYRLTKAQIRSVGIQHTTVCQNCQRPVGDGWVAIAPDSRVYHITCKPKLPPRKYLK